MTSKSVSPMAHAATILSCICIFAVSDAIHAADAEKQAPSAAGARVPVGMVGKVQQVVIPGGELEALPDSDPMARIVVRVAETYRHGDAYRYDLEFTGFEPGRYDLTKSLKRKNPNDPAGEMPPVEVEITSGLEPGRIEPAKPAPPEIRPWQKYWTKLNIFIGCWIAGLAGLFAWSNQVARAAAMQNATVNAPPPTVAERLRPLVQAAREGTIEPHARAELESLLIAYWTDRLGLNETGSPGRILSELKSDAEAGPLISKLEEWLHMPPGSVQASETEITELLKPYEHIAVPSGEPVPTGKESR